MSEKPPTPGGNPTFALALAYNELLALLYSKGLISPQDINQRLENTAGWLRERNDEGTAEYVEALRLKLKAEGGDHGG